MEDIMKQRSLLQNKLNEINRMLSEKIGSEVNLQIYESENYIGETYFSLYDNTNLKSKCGIMSGAFKSVMLRSSGVYWDKNFESVVLDLSFQYENIKSGKNGISFCSMIVKNDMVEIC